MGRSWSVAVRVTAVYVVIGALWILLSDQVVNDLVADAEARAAVQLYKGWGFVAVTGVVTALLVHHYVAGIERTSADLEAAYDDTLSGWALALDLRDRSTAQHTERVAALTEAVALRWGLSEDDVRHVRRGAMLHDIGKMGVPDSILAKAGPLTDDEWAVMRTHPSLAHRMLSKFEHLQSALEIPWCHHERWDGQGYPRGLAGEDIPLSARLFAVVDVFDAITSERPYRQPMPVAEALTHIRAGAGTHFDPAAVEVFEQVLISGGLVHLSPQASLSG